MPSLKDIRKRISSVKNTEQITKAMKMVAAAKLRKAQEACEQARPFAVKLDEAVALIVAGIDEEEIHELLTFRPVTSVDLVVIASDRGLCGAFNGNVLRRSDQMLKDAPKQGLKVNLICVGKRARDYYKGRPGVKIVADFVDVASALSFGTAELVTKKLVERFLAGESDSAVMIYTHFKSAMTQFVTDYTLLPLRKPEMVAANELEHAYEPDRKELLDSLLPRQVSVQVMRALLESVASEHGARMTAMDSASTNAAEMIDKLTLQMNRARQAIITTELMEIVGGKEALEQ